MTGEPKTWLDTDRRIAFYNASGEDIPPYACMEQDYNFESGKSAVEYIDYENIFHVVKPTSDGAKYPGLLLFNTESIVPANGWGTATLAPIMLAFYDDTDGVVEPGQDVGAKSGSWALTAKGKGFKVKSYDSAQAYYVNASQRSIWVEIDSNMLEVVFVTSTEKDMQGFYPGVVQRYDPIGLTWETLFTCKVLDANE